MIRVDSEVLLTTVEDVSDVKCKPGQGKLNRFAASAQKTILGNGHAAKRFKRDYVALTSSYICPDCGATAIVRVNPGEGEMNAMGTALLNKCSKVS